MGDRIAVLSAGRLQQVGTPRAIYEKPRSRFVATFLGTPPMNVVRGRVASGTCTVAGVEVGAPAALKDGEIDLAFRPERARLAATADDDEACLPGTVSFLEFLGDETIVHVALAGADGEVGVVKVRVAGFADLKRGVEHHIFLTHAGHANRAGIVAAMAGVDDHNGTATPTDRDGRGIGGDHTRVGEAGCTGRRQFEGEARRGAAPRALFERQGGGTL